MSKNYVEPVYKIIKEEIVEDILSGVFEPGSMIPKQVYYAEKYDVSRLTVRKAIDDLVAKGVLVTHKGKGTFVQGVVSNLYGYRRLGGFSSNVLSSQARLEAKVVCIEVIPASKSIAKYLGIGENDRLVKIERLRYVNDVPVAYQKSYLDYEKVKNIDFTKEDLSTDSLYRVLHEKAGLIPTYTDEQFRAVHCPVPIAYHLQMEENDPILYVKRVTYMANNVPMEYSLNYEVTDITGANVKSLNL